MYCKNHTNRASVAHCEKCGDALCQECAGTHKEVLCDKCVQKANGEFIIAEIIIAVFCIAFITISLYIKKNYFMPHSNDFNVFYLIFFFICIFLSGMYLSYRYILREIKVYIPINNVQSLIVALVMCPFLGLIYIPYFCVKHFYSLAFTCFIYMHNMLKLYRKSKDYN